MMLEIVCTRLTAPISRHKCLQQKQQQYRRTYLIANIMKMQTIANIFIQQQQREASIKYKQQSKE